MILVTIELLPGGSSTRRRTLATIEIANVSDLAPTSDYRVETFEGRNPLAGVDGRETTVIVRGHDRRRSVLRLVEKAIEASLASFDKD
ncbi:hypothetical protein [Bradyrhizobium genosp. A]|uniref:hypothetical protein n=1 Tax=Bradyrhizobium genosp. A TaxID=83626 RepID=UPI003CEA35C0